MFAPAWKMAGDLPIQKTKIMNDKNLDRQAENMLDNVNETISLLVRKIEKLEQDLIESEKQHEESLNDLDELEKQHEESLNDLVELEKQHEESLKVAYNKGYDDAVLMYRNY